MTYRVTIPANTSATLRLPVGDGLYVYESGEVAEEAEGVTYVETADGYATYEVGSGSYLFTVSTEDPNAIKGIGEKAKPSRQDVGTYYNLEGMLLPDESAARGIVITGGKKIIKSN